MTRMFCILIIGSLAWPAAGQDQGKRQRSRDILFEVNNRKVTSEEFIYLYRKNHQSTSGYTAADINEYLDLFVNFKLKVEEARSRGMDTTAAFLSEYRGYRNELLKPYLPDSRIMDSLVTQAYDRMKEEVRASHLLISLPADAAPGDTLRAYNRALEIRESVRAGEDFGSLAAAYSDDPQAKSSGGDLGFFTALQMVHPFETAAYEAKPGELVGPVRTQFGYHLIKVTDRRPARGQVAVSHIMLRTGGERDSTEVREKIFNLYDQLMAGASWDELCAEYSEDPGSKSKGGSLPPFGVGAMAAVPNFERVAFSLRPGDISDPFQTAYGWHILRVDQKMPLPSFEEMKPTLRNRIASDGRFEALRDAWMEKLRNDYSFSERIPVKDALFTLSDSLIRKGKWHPVPEALTSQTLFALDAQHFTVSSFEAYVRRQTIPAAEAPRHALERLYDQFVEESLMDAVSRAVAASKPEFRMLDNEYYEGILLFDIMEKEVWNRAVEDTAGQAAFFKANRSRYMAGRRAKATIYASPDSMVMRHLRDLAASGDTAALKGYAEKHGIRSEQGLFEEGDREALKGVPWTPGLHSAQNKGMYYLAWIFEILPPGEKTLDEARANVTADYQNELEQRWIRQLRKKYPVKINDKAKRYVLDQLQKR
ncbi:MAG TPA: peptidylprolyl isomerase [Cyclobacteriaceae bacterium]|nr:peptidylprolyl isomerase [Cyclobacteriaceae bacterium]